MNTVPEVEKYLKMVSHNFETLDFLTSAPPPNLKQIDFSDWQVTMIFYICCIYVKSVMGAAGIDIENHYSLRREITSHPDLKKIFNKYRKLEEASRDARYEGRKFEKRYILETILPRFFFIRDCVVEVLKKSGYTSVPVLNPTPLFQR